MNEEKDQAARIGKELGHLADPADVLRTVFGRESQVAIQTLADVVSIQDIGLMTPVGEKLFGRHRQRRFTGARQARQPDRAAFLAQLLFTILLWIPDLHAR